MKCHLAIPLSMKGITLESMALVAAGGAAVLLAYTCLHRQAAATPTTTLNLPTANLPQATPTLANSSFALITGVAPGTMGEGIAEALAALGCRIAAVEHPSRLGSCEESCARLRKVYGVSFAFRVQLNILFLFCTYIYSVSPVPLCWF